MKIYVNEKERTVEKGVSAFAVRAFFKADADVVILNGHLIGADMPLKDGDRISLIKKGEIPPADELESLLVSRHTPGVHEKMKKAKIAVAGLGGLGSNIAVSLARMGAGDMLLADYDVVEPSNINRQQYFVDQIGMKKTDALRANLERINPYASYTYKDIFLTEENTAEIFKGYDVIIEAIDKAETKAMIIRECAAKCRDSFIIGASGLAGYADTSVISVRFAGKMAIAGDFVNEAKPGQGLMAPRVAVAANIQANLAVRYILGDLQEVKR
ncbi:sulfur carrier protein ThiS adenylyltransferase ThiF [Geovibrio thiophilus]|uniref:Sulfur carrier protein ThiS adenylyltransferase ThiF n=1 Tax=Geovibrio thiophilus TaxID=139438 RepID=A0A3R5UZQ2_9BACT|nr:sulfur carrier protein ThiS adenylyltransferase ThiF [Geovibrio thiophilus]QAR32225.1 sulfur carrier protein ThiS adenylyltransferase ThiF [Geovibrio thiophilus]